jgi:hypothetical protein
MEGLAVIVTILFTLAIISGPIGIAIARIKTKSFITLIIKRIFHGIFIALGTIVGAQWLLIPGLPLTPRLIGLSSLCLSYVGARDEYFPQFRIVRRGGRSNGNDGHGPSGQH